MSVASKIKAKKQKPQIAPVTDAEHSKVIELLSGRTMEMSFTVHGIPKSRKIGGKLADQVAASVSGKRKGVRSSWSMFTSDHPAVRELNQAIRDLDQLRDTWTIVRSAEVQRGDNEKVTIEGGKRLIWDKDVPEFYKLFVLKARQIDACAEKLQYAMDNITYDANGKVIQSVKDLDRENAGDAWNEAAYPQDLTLTVGVAKERDSDGKIRLDADGVPYYVINFSEYHVSEKLPELLRERAIQRIDDGLANTIETAMSYAVNDLCEQMMTFLGELTNRVKVYPITTGVYGQYYQAEVVKKLDSETDSKIPKGYVKVLLRYSVDDTTKASKWLGPIPEKEFILQLKPQGTSEKKKIYPSVIEGIITQLQAFKDKKAKMLGVYGSNVVAAFEPLLEALLSSKTNAFQSNTSAATSLAGILRTDEEAKQAVSKAITDTVEALEDQVTEVKTCNAKRRNIKKSMIGVSLNDDL